MAQHDLTISNAEYNQMMAVLDGIRTRLGPLREPLAKMIVSQPAKVRAFIQTEDGRLLREVWKFYRDVNTFMDHVDLEAGE